MAGSGRIAIIGHACRFPGGADSPESFREMLLRGEDAIGSVPADRFDQRNFYHPIPGQAGKSYTFAAGTIGDISGFDAGFFDISAREAVQIDPQQRLLLELTWEAIERAGLLPAEIEGSDCAVFVGISGSDYAERRMGDLGVVDTHFMLGATLSIAANRISYMFNLHGPSVAVDTACSSSLVALAEAVKTLESRRSRMAIVGGVNMLLSPASFVGFARASMLSPTGRCRPFARGADGYVRAEGGGVVLLKRLEDAERDGDPILALIRGVDVNNDGRTRGISLPSSESQEELLRRLYRKARINPADISYFEAHGTGTPVGDPAEVGAIGRAVAARRPADQPLPIGSVKGNIGHLEPAAGIAGLIKAIEILRHGVVPPSLHSDDPNPDIPFEALNVRPVGEAMPLSRRDGRALIGVNSFGFGGTNAHVVIESPPATPALAPPTIVRNAPGSALPLILSARSRPALEQAATRMRDLLGGCAADQWPDIAYTLACRRTHHEHRLMLHAADAADARRQLDGWLHPAGIRQEAAPGGAKRGKTALVFVGNGSQWAGMGARLLQEDARFRTAVERFDAVARWRLGWSAAQMFANPTVAMDDTLVAQPLLFVLQIGLVEALRARGLQYDGVVGHSVGEVAAAHVAGALSLEQAVEVILTRSGAQARTRGTGRMLATACGVTDAIRHIADHGGAIEIAAENGPRGVTLSGETGAILDLQRMLKAGGLASRLLDLDYAFHSHLQDPTRDHLLDGLARLTPGDADLAFYSTVSGGRMNGRALGADHWWHNIRQRVEFAKAVRAMEADGFRIFVEIGPQPVMQGSLRALLENGRTLPTLHCDADGAAALDRALHGAFLAGARIDFAGRFPAGGRIVPLPTYPWQRERHWTEPTPDATPGFSTPQDGRLLGMRLGRDVAIWENQLDPATMPMLADHAIDGNVVVPATLFVGMALEAGTLLFGDGPIEVERLEIERPLIVEAGAGRVVRFHWSADSRRFRIESRPRGSASGWTRHAGGRLALAPAAPASPVGPIEMPARRLSSGEHYAITRARGFDYGPIFRTVDRIDIDEAGIQATALLRSGEGEDGHLVDPAMLDGALQAAFPLLADRADADDGLTLLPSSIGRLVYAGRSERDDTHWQAHVALTGDGERSAALVIAVEDAAGRPLLTMSDVRLTRVQLRRAGRDATARRHRWESEPLRPLVAQPTPPAAFDAAREAVAPLPTPDAELLDRIALAFAADALLALGDRPIVPDQEALLARLIERVEPLLADEATLADPGALWREAMRRHPHLLPELLALGSVGRRLADQLAGDGPAILDPGLAERLFEGGPHFGRPVDAVVTVVRAFVAAWPRHRRLRLLEIGGGHGGLTRRLVEELAPVAADLLIVEPDAALAERLAGLFAERADIAVESIDLLSDEARARGPFDLIVGAHALRRLPGDPQALLARLGELGTPGAALVLGEHAPSAWTELLFGADMRAPLADIAAAAGLGQIASPAATGIELVAAATPGAMIGAQIVEPRRWLLVADGTQAETALAEELANVLRSRGQEVEHLSPAALEARIAQTPDTGIVHLAGLLPDAERAGDPIAVQRRRCELALSAAHRLSRHGGHGPLLFVTGRALAAEEGAPTDPAQAAIAGLARVLRNEAPNLRCRTIDLHMSVHEPKAIDALATEIMLGGDHAEVMLTPTGRHGPLLRAIGEEEQGSPATGQRQLLRAGGSIDKLRWETVDRAPLADDEVEIETEAAGLNFRDVMLAMKALPETLLEGGFAGPTLGMEAAGRVTRVGAGVTDLRAGDRVACFAPAAFASHVVTKRFAVAKIPEGMTMAESAGMITAFFTVTYALHHVARLRAGERILIHGAAGGVGLAALQYARACGAEAFCSVGNAEKRDFLILSGVSPDHIVDSRSMDFADRIRAATGGEGVDVVLNSLAGEAIHRGIALLKPFGRFIELGKVDFVADTPLGLRPFRNNISFHGVDADQLMACRPELAAEIFHDTMDMFARGVYAPLPYRSFPRAAVADAFRHLQRARNIGKVVVDLRPPAAPPSHISAEPAARPLTIDRGGTFLVTGGTRGMGLVLAGWLAGHRPARLVLVSRTGTVADEDRALLDQWRAEGVAVECQACDLADAAAVERLVSRLNGSGPPLKGVVHAATVYDDSVIAELTPERMDAVTGPKAGGAWALHRATERLDLDLFLLLSSVSATIGNIGQANYVAANLFVESLAALRRARGLAAQLLALGPVAGTGQLAEQAQLEKSFAQIGMRTLDREDIVAALDGMLAKGDPFLLLADVDWRRLASLVPAVRGASFRMLRAGGGKQDDTATIADFRTLAATLGAEELYQLVLHNVAEVIAQTVRMPVETIDADRSLLEFGLDSLMGIELRMLIEERFGIEISPLLLADDISVARVARLIVSQLTGSRATEAAPETAAPDQQQKAILLRHAEHIDIETIGDALREVKEESAQPRLIP